MSGQYCQRCRSELPPGVTDALCESCRQSLAGYVTRGPERTTAAGSATAFPGTPAPADPTPGDAGAFAIDAFWAEVAGYRQALDELQAAADARVIALNQ